MRTCRGSCVILANPRIDWEPEKALQSSNILNYLNRDDADDPLTGELGCDGISTKRMSCNGFEGLLVGIGHKTTGELFHWDKADFS